jgi:hypothetical protein
MRAVTAMARTRTVRTQTASFVMGHDSWLMADELNLLFVLIFLILAA